VGGVATDLALGRFHVCALLGTGSVRCWGENRLGYGPEGPWEVGYRNTPADAGDVPVGGWVVEIAAGEKHTCALLDSGGVRCWGDNEFGQLGYGHTDDIGIENTPEEVGDVPLADPGIKAVHIAAGGNHTCAALTSGAVRCWGRNDVGQLGLGHTRNIGDNEPASAGGDIQFR